MNTDSNANTNAFAFLWIRSCCRGGKEGFGYEYECDILVFLFSFFFIFKYGCDGDAAKKKGKKK